MARQNNYPIFENNSTVITAEFLNGLVNNVNTLNQEDGVFDISIANAVSGVPTTYNSLELALSGTSIPVDVRKGGMAVKFINSGTGKYEQWCLKATSFSSTESDWVSVSDMKAEDVSYGESNVKEELDNIDSILNGDIHESDITSDADFQLTGIWLNNGVVNTSTYHYISKTLHFNTGDKIRFYCKTASGAATYLMYIAPTSADLVQGDTRAFTSIGTQVNYSAGWNTLEYTVQDDSYMIFESARGMSLYVTPSSNAGLVEDVDALKNSVTEALNTATALNDQINGSTPVTNTNIGNVYTQFRNKNGGKIKITITAIASGDHSTIGVYIKTLPNVETYKSILFLQNQVGAEGVVDLGASTYDGYFYIKNDYNAKMTVEWVRTEGFIDDIQNIASQCPVFMPFNNIALPKNPASYKILVIGNSFSASMYVNILQICSAANISGLIFGRTYAGGSSLQDQYNAILNKTANRDFAVSVNGASFTEESNKTIEYALEYTDWDMIILHEKSERSGMIEYYKQWLPKLVGILRSYKTTKKAKIAMQLTWAMSEDSTYDYLDTYYNSSQTYMFERLCEVYSLLKTKFGIDIIIPNHLSIQNARHDNTIMSIEDISDLTGDDGLHLNSYGQYIQAATFFELVIAPMFNKTIWDNSYRNSKITDNNHLRFKACAVLACSYDVVEGTGNAMSIDNYINLNSNV